MNILHVSQAKKGKCIIIEMSIYSLRQKPNFPLIGPFLYEYFVRWSVSSGY